MTDAETRRRRRAKAKLGEARDAIAMQAIVACDQQRDAIGDSDLDDEQPIRLSIVTRLGFIRKARQFYQWGHEP